MTALPPDVLQLSELLQSLGAIERSLSAGLARALSEENVSLDQWRVLDLVDRLGSPSMGELADATAMPNASLSRTVDSLEDAASVFRLPSAADKRRLTVQMSDHGLQRLTRMRTIVTAWDARSSGALGPVELRALNDAAVVLAERLGIAQ